MAATKTPIRVLLFLLLFSFFFHPSAEARKKDGPQITQDLTGVQPYPHQWIEAKGKKDVSLIGQAYRPRPDLFVMELNSFPDGETEIKSVKLKTADGKVIEGRIRRLPFNFMPTARQHYANPQMDDAGQAPQQINGPAQEHS